MVDIPDELKCLFSAAVESHEDSHVIEVPTEETEAGEVVSGETYRIAVLPQRGSHETESTNGGSAEQQATELEPPVKEGETREVTIESLGDQGDGIARVERGFVVIVPDAQPDDEVLVKIENVTDNVAFARNIKDASTAF